MIFVLSFSVHLSSSACFGKCFQKIFSSLMFSKSLCLPLYICLSGGLMSVDGFVLSLN